MVDLLISRFERYFRHPDTHHDVLRVNDRAVACKNVRRALGMLGVRVEDHSPDPQLFDEALEASVRRFQDMVRHRVCDGEVGPGTRTAIVSNLLGRFDPSIFARFDRLELDRTPSVFLSYARLDADKVNKLDQWLRDRGVRVIRDTTDFVAGTNLPENVRRCIAQADKVVVIHSVNSRSRDWVGFEKSITEEIERRIATPILIYLRLDDVSLPQHDPSRLAIDTAGRTLREIGQDILHAVTGAGPRPALYEYDEDKPL